MNTESLTNGCIRIARKGRVKFAFGDDPEFTIDVLAVWDEWYQVDASLRGADGKLPPDKVVAWNDQRRAFVENTAMQASGNRTAVQLSHAEVGEFMARLGDEVAKMRAFFEPIQSSAAPPSSPESTDIRFSQ